MMNSSGVNPFVHNTPFLYSLKTSENPTVFSCFQGGEKGCIGNEWVKLWYRMHNLLYHRLRERRMNRKEKYQIALTLELIHKLIFAELYTHLLLLFAFYWTGNFI